MYDTAVRFYPKTKRFFVVASSMEEAHAIIDEDRAKEAGG
jgi:hypothetical protein